MTGDQMLRHVAGILVERSAVYGDAATPRGYAAVLQEVNR
jgi:hypothetical protein